MNIFGLFWGLVVLLIGVVFLGVNFGWWSPMIWGQILQLWPVLLIILGIRLLIRSSIIVLILSLILIGLAIAYGVVSATPLADQPGVQRFMRWQPRTSGEQATFTQEQAVDSDDTFVLDLGGLYDVAIEGSSSAESIQVNLKGPKELIDGLTFEKSGNQITLKDTARPNMNYWFRVVTDDVEGTITVPQAIALQLKLSGVSNVRVSDFQGDVTIDMSGASNVRFEDSTALDPQVDLSGAGKVAFDICRGKEAKFDISGAASITAESCVLDVLDIQTSGTGKVDIQSGSIKDLTVRTSGASSITVPRPSGDIEQDTSGTSKVRFR